MFNYNNISILSIIILYYWVLISLVVFNHLIKFVFKLILFKFLIIKSFLVYLKNNLKRFNYDIIKVYNNFKVWLNKKDNYRNLQIIANDTQLIFEDQLLDFTIHVKNNFINTLINIFNFYNNNVLLKLRKIFKNKNNSHEPNIEIVIIITFVIGSITEYIRFEFGWLIYDSLIDIPIFELFFYIKKKTLKGLWTVFILYFSFLLTCYSFIIPGFFFFVFQKKLVDLFTITSLFGTNLFDFFLIYSLVYILINGE